MTNALPTLDARLDPLVSGLSARPGITAVVDGAVDTGGLWSVCFAIDVTAGDGIEEVRRLAWLFNNLYGALPDTVAFRPVVIEDHASGERHLCWLLESLAPDYTPDRALDVLLTPLPAFEPPLAPGA